jgi:hypothetical protein
MEITLPFPIIRALYVRGPAMAFPETTVAQMMRHDFIITRIAVEDTDHRRKSRRMMSAINPLRSAGITGGQYITGESALRPDVGVSGWRGEMGHRSMMGSGFACVPVIGSA